MAEGASMFASQHAPLTLPVPGEPGQTVTIRKLSHKALHDAEVEMIRRRGREGRALSLLNEPDPVARYDAGVLIQRSVQAWDPPRTAPAPGSELETWLAREILRLSHPRLFEAG
jgi:hypothetical protein